MTEAPAAGITLEELQLAARNHGMPLEALRFDVTPAGLHYLLIHYDIPAVDPDTWRLEVGGRVERPLSLSLADLRGRESVEAAVTLECAGNGRARLEPRPISQPWLSEAVGTARWRGTPLRPLLEEAAPSAGAIDVVFTGLDRGIEGGQAQAYERALPVDEALAGGAFLAYEMNGAPLPPQHGFPVRLVVPAWYGMASVKWLARITVGDRPFDGYQQRWAYRFRQREDEAGDPVTRMFPRSLMAPPGMPEFLTRERTVLAGPCRLIGRAWSGFAPIESVEVSTDGGETWAGVELDDPLDGSPWAWRGWRYDWEAAPGRYVVCSRARDAAGNVQPPEPPWNLGGYANNAVQRIAVAVTAAD